MRDLAGLDALARALGGGAVFLLLFAGARARFSERERRRGPADVGLD